MFITSPGEDYSVNLLIKLDFSCLTKYFMKYYQFMKYSCQFAKYSVHVTLRMILDNLVVYVKQ